MAATKRRKTQHRAPMLAIPFIISAVSIAAGRKNFKACCIRGQHPRRSFALAYRPRRLLTARQIINGQIGKVGLAAQFTTFVKL
jgi:hypothetical protein